MLVHDVIAAMTTEPCLNVYYFPSIVAFPDSSLWAGSIENPLKPNFAFIQD